MFYLIPFFLAISIVIGMSVLSGRSRTCQRLLASPDGHRHIGGRALVRSGGMVMALAFFSILLAHPDFVVDERTSIIFIVAAALLIVGIIDDVKSVPWCVQLAAQMSAVVAIILAGVQVTHLSHPLGGVISFEQGIMVIVGAAIMIVWVVGIINALNWSDGMHGVFGGIGVIASGTLFLLALRPEVYQPPIALMTAVLGGAMLGFTIANLYGKRVIAGTSGTYFFGFLIAVLAFFAGAKIGTTLLVLIVPLVDALYVLQNRLRRGQKLTAADTTHLHHRLLARGWKQSQILTVYYSLTLFGATLALSTQAIGKVFVLVVYTSILLISFFLLTRGHTKEG